MVTDWAWRKVLHEYLDGWLVSVVIVHHQINSLILCHVVDPVLVGSGDLGRVGWGGVEWGTTVGGVRTACLLHQTMMTSTISSREKTTRTAIMMAAISAEDTHTHTHTHTHTQSSTEQSTVWEWSGTTDLERM